jgi:hypothetical protein
VNPPNPKIRRAIRSDAAAVARIVATAFHDLDICQWLVPDPTERAAILPGHFRIVVDHAINHGTVETTTDLAAVAVWLPSSAPAIPRYGIQLTAAVAGSALLSSTNSCVHDHVGSCFSWT